MLRPLLLMAALLPLICSTSVYAETNGTPLEWAVRLVNELKPDQTSYTHDAPVVQWKGVRGAAAAECRTDCSGLLDRLLKQSYGYSDDDFKNWLGRVRPLAKTYHDAIVAGNRFKRLERVADVRPGDIIAIKYSRDDPENKGGDTGHIMIVAATPEFHKATEPLQEATEQWAVTVIDECKSYHGHGDTRYEASGKDGKGAGRGVFRLYTDKDGRVAGYAWSLLKASDYHDQAERPLVIGRLEP